MASEPYLPPSHHTDLPDDCRFQFCLDAQADAGQTLITQELEGVFVFACLLGLGTLVFLQAPRLAYRRLAPERWRYYKRIPLIHLYCTLLV
jgi:hypothetical protein